MNKYIKVPVDISTIKKVVHIYHINMKITSTKEINHPSFVLRNVQVIDDQYEYFYELRFKNTKIPEGLQDILNNCDQYFIKGISTSAEKRDISYKDVDFDSNIDYFYYHQDIKVNCKYCKGTFRISELTDYCSDDDQTYETNICPHCDMPNCVHLEYEKISDRKIEEMIKDGIINIE